LSLSQLQTYYPPRYSAELSGVITSLPPNRPEAT
jgi:hypothetical protein